MIVVDVETTGVDSLVHSILSIGAVDMTDSPRQFYGECRMWEGAHIMEGSLSINGYTEDEVRDPAKKPESELVQEFLAWYEASGEQTFVGHNPTLDYEFIRRAADRADANFPIAKRTIDLHTVCWMHLLKQGKEIPRKNMHSGITSDFISDYVGIPAEPRPHIALNGAKWESEQLSRLFFDKPFIDEFKEYPIPWLSEA